MKKGFSNVQVSVKTDFKNYFDEVYMESEANSKGEFLNMLLENYLNPDYEKALLKAQAEKDKEITELRKKYENNSNEVSREIDRLTDDLNGVRTELLEYNNLLSPYFKQANGKTFDLPNRKKIKVSKETDLLKIILTSIKLK